MRLYQYDLFGRLVQVRSLGQITNPTLNAATGLPEGELDGLGRVLVHYTYDGLGRLIRVQRPEPPSPSEPNSEPQTFRVTDLYHDGVRVVQEVVLRNVAAREVVTLDEETNQFTHHLPVEMDQFPSSLELDDPPQGFDAYPGSAWTLEREFIHATDPGAYVDEVLAQLVYLDAEGNPSFGQPPITLYTLRDANFNVVALADEYGRLAAQYTYDPYGKVRSAELMANPATGPPSDEVDQIDPNLNGNTYWNRVLAATRTNRLGFQGLPAERLDVEGPWLDPLATDGLTSWGGGNNLDILGGVPPASHEVVYHARNRVFSPRHQRFTSVDPNKSGIPTLHAIVWGGLGFGTASVMPDDSSDGVFMDGMNRHVAFAMDPHGHTDPLGCTAYRST